MEMTRLRRSAQASMQQEGRIHAESDEAEE